MGERLYCFITGKGVLINWGKEKNLRNKTEEAAWKEAFKKKGVIINKNKSRKDLWQQIFNNWNNGDWGQIDSSVGLNGCIIWIKKKEKFNPQIKEEVNKNHANQIVQEIKRKLNSKKYKKYKEIDEIIILVHAKIDDQVKQSYSKINITEKEVPIKWYPYTTAGGGAGMINLVEIVINAIYSCDITNLCDELSNALLEVEKKIEASEQGKSLSLLKHQIVNILEPLRIDIDWLIDKNFENKYWYKVSKYWTGEKVEEIFKNINKVIEDFLGKKNSKKEIEDFVENIKHRINEVEDLFRVSQLLNALKNNDKKTAKSICNLHSNIYKKWMDGLINEFEKMKSNLE
jgi:hypothetical protein